MGLHTLHVRIYVTCINDYISVRISTEKVHILNKKQSSSRIIHMHILTRVNREYAKGRGQI